jgi:transcriptional regulator with XRE-family HTH domain
MREVNAQSDKGDVMRDDYSALTREPRFRQIIKQEDLILDVTEALSQALDESGMTQSDLARKLGRSRGFVSQLFAGRNLTLRTIADVALALGQRPSLKLYPEYATSQYENHWEEALRWSRKQSKKIVLHPSSFSQGEKEQLIA